ncbi:hypothetical protein D3C73_278570 [compost metagenome]
MEAFIYILFSVLDGLAIFIFAFNSFRIRLIEYWKEILFTVSVISVGTYLFSESAILKNISPLITIILFIVALIFYFRISLLSALRVTIVGFVAQIALTLVVTSIFCLVANMSFNEVKETTFMRYILQFSGDFITILVSALLKRKRIWVTNLPYSYTFKFKISRTNLVLIFTSIIVTVFISNIGIFNNIFISAVLWLLIAINISLFEVRKEMRQEYD